MKKKYILLFVLLFFLSILIACGSNSEVTNNTSNYNPTPTSDNPTSTPSSTPGSTISTKQEGYN